MGYEIVAATLVGSICSIITILLWQRGTWKKMELEHNYNIKRFKLGKKYKLQEQELPKQNQKSLLDQLKSLDIDKVQAALKFLGSDEEPENEGDLSNILKDLVASNPELVNQFLKGLSDGSKKKTDEPQNFWE